MLLSVFVTTFILSILLIALLVWNFLRGNKDRQNERMMEVIAPAKPEAPESVSHKVYKKLSLYGQKLILRFGVRISDDLRVRLQFAGLKSDAAIDIFYIVQFFCPFVGMLVGALASSRPALWAVIFGVVLYLTPKLWLSYRIRSKQNQIRRALPDMTDLLMICIDAGLGLDQSMLRVSHELKVSRPHLQEEIARVLLEQAAGVPRVEAWQHLATRVDLTEVNLFVNMLLQSDRFGTPIVRGLRQFAEELRQKRRHKAEEAAARAHIKILFPLVLFIFPCLFIVMLAPALLNVMDEFHKLGQ